MKEIADSFLKKKVRIGVRPGKEEPIWFNEEIKFNIKKR